MVKSITSSISINQSALSQDFDRAVGEPRREWESKLKRPKIIRPRTQNEKEMNKHSQRRRLKAKKKDLRRVFGLESVEVGARRDEFGGVRLLLGRGRWLGIVLQCQMAQTSLDETWNLLQGMSYTLQQGIFWHCSTKRDRDRYLCWERDVCRRRKRQSLRESFEKARIVRFVV